MSVDVTQVYEEISNDEGKILHCYMCSEGHKTVGIGHKVLQNDPESNLPVHGAYDDVPESEGIDEARCYELFQSDVQIAIDGCTAIYDNWDDLPQEIKHILTNMCFPVTIRISRDIIPHASCSTAEFIFLNLLNPP